MSTSTTQDPLYRFHKQFQSFVQNNPNVISAARAASQIPESAKAVVVLSPYSLKHVFPRDWVSKSYKKTIVERPERLLASSLGIAAAITMYPALFTLKSSHYKKSSLLSPHVLKVHGNDWPRNLLEICKQADTKLQNNEIEVPDNWNAGDIYLSSKTIEALEGSIAAIETGIDSIFNGPSPEHICNRAFVAIRPPGHHCKVATPSGFCLLNNAHISIEYAADHYGITHAVILDFDLHHGDGTQDICWKRAGFRSEDEPEGSEGYDDFGKKFAEFPKVGYFSMHDINSFPTETGYATKVNIRNASTCIMDGHDLNIWNIHLSPWNTEEDFQKLYQSKYRTLFAKADDYFRNAKYQMAQEGKPFKGLVVISAGFDASEYEQTSMQRHNVNVPTNFYTMFTKDALKLAQIHCQGKVLSLLEGGYSDKALTSGVFAHLIGFQNQNWINEWGSEQVVKEIVRGCKPHWKPYKTKKSRDVIRIWAEEVIRLGRSMIPEYETSIVDDLRKNVTTNERVTQRITRSHDAKKTSSSSPRQQTSENDALQKNLLLAESMKKENNIITSQTNSRRRVTSSGLHSVPFSKQDLPSDDEEDDDDYVYDEQLNKTFNRTVEDITIDDISRHLETLELAYSDNDDDNNDYDNTTQKQKQKQKSSSSTRKSNNSQKPNRTILNYDDSDISMISHVTPRRFQQHSTRSGARW
ncbi:hypothetical protein TBLA_0E04080 [Henningerozyma blattae CBS 6284]|uniref:Histone deacetylase domain-containing protein n=1 Tax=Henningerozyma blattae (strain ATCC 34711 / CBS 6284 / DSM 70876 / NBRC 10599 / NRRL Y-10934 / UCD 77-7) TaxID=1071380 RepID=I2H511_HENB6|nr:hypothetical protein TBLA_0E04080 [Tetrapisispora blattae CBS 6284]CCH61463.1 hypothetical protein TBLA_0E04080 [Tetrapisispora blattae CBS 6284]